MAKKKTAETANIKAAPVLRSGGDNPTPETPVITKSYCVRDDWKDQDKVNYVAFKSVDGVVQDLTVNGQPAGGGGGRQATVSVTNNTSGLPLGVYGPVVINNVNTYDFSQNPNWPVERGSTVSFTVLLGSGGANLFIGNIPSEDGIVTTGAISYNSDLLGFIVTGNGTITVN